MYKDTLGDVPQMQTSSISKINIICNAFIAAFENKSAHLQNLITAHVCKEPPDLEGGLRIISHLRGMTLGDHNASNVAGVGEDVAEKAAEHICFLADVHQLYDHALGIYDLDVALLIAQQSQMV
jgi:elongator complex protein 1